MGWLKENRPKGMVMNRKFAEKRLEQYRTLGGSFDEEENRELGECIGYLNAMEGPEIQRLNEAVGELVAFIDIGPHDIHEHNEGPCWNCDRIKLIEKYTPKEQKKVSVERPIEEHEDEGMKAGEKYKAFHWSEGWVDVLFIGKEYFFGVSDKGVEGSWVLSGNWIHIPKPEPRKKPSERLREKVQSKMLHGVYCGDRIDEIVSYLDELFEQGKL